MDFDAHNLKHTQFAWTGGKDPFSHQRIFKLDEMVGPQSRFGFTLQCWDGKYVPISLYCVFLLKSKVHRSAVPITDNEDRVIAVLAGSPDDEGWREVHREAANALERSRDKLKKPSERDLKHQE